MEQFDVAGILRRIRRCADLSQRELADACGLATSVIAHAEAGRRGIAAVALARAAAVAGYRLALVDTDGHEVSGMAADAVRDRIGRRFPAHLDVVLSEERWTRWADRYDRSQPTYTFDRDRMSRDRLRNREGTPEDHRTPEPGDSPEERRAAGQREARKRKEEDRRRRLASGELQEAEPFICSCPPGCDELDDWSGRPVHAPECACGCDVG